jgi:hypothetical protein
MRLDASPHEHRCKNEALAMHVMGNDFDAGMSALPHDVWTVYALCMALFLTYKRAIRYLIENVKTEFRTVP